MNHTKKFMQSLSAIAMTTILSTGILACSENNNEPSAPTDTKDTALQAAITAYIDNAVIPTYKTMADEAILLSDLCGQARDLFVAGDIDAANNLISSACQHWTASRKAWELSEAWLYGAAADYNIDPHIDSWPLDRTALVALLSNSSMMQNIGEGGAEWVSANLGYGLLGFHAIEYMLYELSSDGLTSNPRNLRHPFDDGTTVTDNHMIYMAAVAEDLRNQCVRLEASWTGMSNITAEKQAILTEAELEPTRNYGEDMKNAGRAGSSYQSLTLAAQQLIQGCIDIVDEVNTQKIGRPNSGTSSEDKSYIESPYALNSVVDFADNIRSVRNAYEGIDNTSSVSDYIATVAPDVDTEVRNLIDECISKIEIIPEPFANHATGNEADAAMESLGNLSKALAKVNTALLQN